MSKVNHCNDKDEAESAIVRKLGYQIGFGRLMQLTQQEWERFGVLRGDIPGASFAYGPCLVFTVPCKCKEPNAGETSCDWCMGAGWVTKKVRAMQDLESTTGVNNG